MVWGQETFAWITEVKAYTHNVVERWPFVCAIDWNLSRVCFEVEIDRNLFEKYGMLKILAYG